jgi:hypothetical protein
MRLILYKSNHKKIIKQDFKKMVKISFKMGRERGRGGGKPHKPSLISKTHNS